MECPNCNVEMVIDDYEEDVSLLEDNISRVWYHVCPKCKKQYIETIYYQMVEKVIEEVK